MSILTQEAVRRNSSRSNADEVEPILISEWPLSRGEIARVSIRSFKGTWLIDLRKWYETGDGQLRASPRGISLSLKHLRRISVAMDEALAAAIERGLIPADDEGGR
jgi:hypothetical protein